MRKTPVVICIFLLVTGFFWAATPSSAQTSPEIGFGMAIESVNPEFSAGQTDLHLPARWLRLTLPFGQFALEIEGAARWATSDGESASSLSLGPSIAFFLNPERDGVFVRGGGGLSAFSFDGGSATQFSAGLGLGYLWRFSSRAGLRTEGSFLRSFETDDFQAANIYRGEVGFQFALP